MHNIWKQIIICLAILVNLVSCGNSGGTGVTQPNTHTYIYISNSEDNTISTCSILESSNTLVNCYKQNSMESLLTYAYQMAINNNQLYIVGYSSNNIVRCNIVESSDLNSCISLGNLESNLVGPTGVAINRIEQKIYITNYDNKTITRCNIGTNGELTSCNSKSTGLSGAPNSIWLNNELAYIVNSAMDASISLCNFNTDICNNLTEPESSSLQAPNSMTIANGYAYIANFGGNNIISCQVLQSGNLSSCNNLELESVAFPSDIAIVNNHVYILNFINSTISMCSLETNGNINTCSNLGNPTGAGLNFPNFITIINR